MTLTRESEALLRNLRVWTTVSPHWEGPEDEVWSYVALDLTRLEAAVRAEQAAEVEGLRSVVNEARLVGQWHDAVQDVPLALRGELLDLYRAAHAALGTTPDCDCLAATPVAPAPAATEPRP